MSLDAAGARSLVAQIAAQTADADKESLEKAQLGKACKMFESQFLKMLWKEMRATVNKSGLIDGGFGENIFTDLLDEAMSDNFTRGGSMGIAEMLERQLSRTGYARPGARIGQPLTSSSRTGENGGEGLGQPVEGGVVSSPFGPRVHPITGQEQMHQGLDLAAELGSAVTAAAAGRVTFTGERGGYGNLVIVTHDDGSQAYYGHCQEMAVQEGQEVAAGQLLATVGETGLATGPHLHFELRDAQGRAVDPAPLLAGGVALTA